MTKIIKIITSTFLILAAAALSSYFTKAGVSGWYVNFPKPSITPANEIFPVVWSILYALMILAMILVIVHPNKNANYPIGRALIIQLFLQILWCFVFFEKQQLGWGLVVIVLMIVEALPMTGYFWKTNKLAGVLILPYLAWLIFAGIINSAFVF